MEVIEYEYSANVIFIADQMLVSTRVLFESEIKHDEDEGEELAISLAVEKLLDYYDLDLGKIRTDITIVWDRFPYEHEDEN